MIDSTASRPSRRSLLAGAAVLAASGPAIAQGVRSYRAGGVPEESIVTALWAQQSGFFHRNGFDLQIESQRAVPPSPRRSPAVHTRSGNRASSR